MSLVAYYGDQAAHEEQCMTPLPPFLGDRVWWSLAEYENISTKFALVGRLTLLGRILPSPIWAWIWMPDAWCLVMTLAGIMIETEQY